MTEESSGEGVYFTLNELGLIVLFAILAFATGAVVPSYLFPGDTVSSIVYQGLSLPGPGAGVLVFGSILCFWLVLGLRIVRKAGTACAIAVVIIALDLLFGQQAVVFQALDVFFFAALVVEIVSLLPVGQKPYAAVLPLLLAGLSVIALVLAVAGRAVTGEGDLPVAGIPAAYLCFGILGLCCAAACWRFPLRAVAAAGVSNLYYMLHFWLFWGTDYFSRFPPDATAIPVLLLVALMGGVAAGFIAHGAGELVARPKARPEQSGKDQ